MQVGMLLYVIRYLLVMCIMLKKLKNYKIIGHHLLVYYSETN